MDNSDKEIKTIVDYFSKCPFFENFKKEDLYRLAEFSDLDTYDESATLFDCGEEAQHFFIICKGLVSVSKKNEDGLSEELARFDDGDTLGEFDFSRSAVYDASAICLNESTIISFPAKNLTMQGIAAINPNLAVQIAHRSVAMISSRIRSTQQTISSNSPWVRELKKTMFTDSGTGLWTRAYLEEEVSKQIAENGVLVFIKPDKFKALCDTYGHDAGDVAMKVIADILRKEASKFEKAWAIRIRSNETGIAIANASLNEAKEVAENLRREYQKIDFGKICDASNFKLDAFVAIATLPSKTENFHNTIEHCHELLMAMWNKNGDKICIL